MCDRYVRSLCVDRFKEYSGVNLSWRCEEGTGCGAQGVDRARKEKREVKGVR